MKSQANLLRRTSSWWPVLGALCAFLAIGFVIAAIAFQKEASAPIGEGELFVADALEASDIVEAAENAERGVREARNQLEIEAVSLVGEDGAILTSTSPSLIGKSVDNGFLAFSIAEGRFAAAAMPIGTPIILDGVTAWEDADVLYQVTYPTERLGALLLHYDVSELFARRARPTGIQSSTLQLLALGVIFAVLGTAVVIGHLRARRRQEAMARESEILRSHARELEEANFELERAKRKAERALELAEEKIRIRSEFVLMINHELRTPLTSLITGARLMREGDLGSAEHQIMLDAMVEDGTRLQEIIDQMLAVARIENRGLSYELTEASLEELEETLAQANATIDSGLDPDEALVVTDLKALGLVVCSLADNARTHGAAEVVIDFGLESAIDAMVEVGTHPDTALHIRIADDGPGIDRDFLPRVFEKFEKSSFSSGTGLGLYMARTIIEALEGSIAVDTSQKGTTFEIALPVTRLRETVVR